MPDCNKLKYKISSANDLVLGVSYNSKYASPRSSRSLGANFLRLKPKLSTL